MARRAVLIRPKWLGWNWQCKLAEAEANRKGVLTARSDAEVMGRAEMDR